VQKSELGKIDAVRDAVSKKRVLPLSLIKGIVVARFGMNIIDIKINEKNDRWIYEFKVISRKGHLLEVYVDGASGKITKVENE
jgi:uncharacterized membrane protein YkoI